MGKSSGLAILGIIIGIAGLGIGAFSYITFSGQIAGLSNKIPNLDFSKIKERILESIIESINKNGKIDNPS